MFTAKPNQKPNQHTVLKPNRDTRTSEQKKKKNPIKGFRERDM